MRKRRKFRRPAADPGATRGTQSGLPEELVPPAQPLPQRRRGSNGPASEPPPTDDDDHIRELTALVDFFRRDG